ncbi:unnamed protein product [Moneuplotes crassus]|uniref:Uncharacterized protein n=1 Tax=Euplotes crassus TaxID=5936 RepID=A0AAD1U7B5_EUPCR|nr:unnamed protein product [Moneuplotes crassus]
MFGRVFMTTYRKLKRRENCSSLPTTNGSIWRLYTDIKRKWVCEKANMKIIRY